MKTGEFEVFSALPPTQCVARLSAATNIPSPGYDDLWNGSGNAFVYGDVTADGFFLRINRPGRNSGNHTYVRGTVRPRTEGATVACEFYFDPEYRKIMWGAAGCAVFLGLPLLLVLLSDFRAGAIQHLSDLFNENYNAQTVGVLTIAAFNCVYPFFRLESKYTSEELKNFLVRVLEAFPSHPTPNRTLKVR